MARLIAAEFQKVFTTRLWLWLLLASMAITALYCSLAIAFSDSPGDPTPPLTTDEGQRTLMAVGAGAAGPLAAILGSIGITGEFRHRIATATFLATPRRGRVVIAKLAVHMVVGVGYAVCCIAMTAAIAMPWLSSRGIDLSPGSRGIPATLTGLVVVVATFALIGVGLGALLREQVATVVGLMLYLFVIEPIVTRIGALESWTVYLPGSAANAVTQIAQSNMTFLAPWQGGLTLLGYGIALAVLGTRFAIRRDIA
jgi:hypothetical protein